ncbi:MAG: iron ABC transporter permease [Candidatus Methanoplasma sp.]|nr:iron ABC transporter permease [Candidatus Methanoplasma sp.]
MASGTVEALRESYSRSALRKTAFVIGCAAAAASLFGASLAVGTRDLDAISAYGLLFDHIMGVAHERGSQLWYDDNIVWNYRLPRAIFAMVAGAGLSVAGAVMQSVMKNPLADPYTTGISSGALFGVAVAVILGFSAGGGSSGFGVTLNAMIFALVPMMAIVSMSAYFRKSPSTLILAGVAISYLFNAGASLLMVSTSEEDLASVYRWQIGDFSGLSWDAVPVALAVCAAGSAIAVILSGKLNLMVLDDKDASSLGLNGDRLRTLCLIVLSVMAASVIAFVGVIGFVGLVVPHMARIALGADNRYVVPASMAFGAAFVLACDVVARSIDVNASVPIGVVTSFVGAPIFLYLIIRSKSKVW